MLVSPRDRTRPRLFRRAPAVAALALCVAASAAAPAVASAASAPGSISFVPVRVLVAAGPNPLPLTGATVRIVSARRGAHVTTLAVGHSYGQGLALVAARSR